jgi:hypothetical protein
MTLLITPKVIVTLEVPGEDDTYREVTVQTDNRDAVTWDILRSRKKWPAGSEAPMLWMTMLAWAALKRTNETTLDEEAFIGSCIQVRSADKEGNAKPLEAVTEDDVTVDPSQPVVGIGS